MADMEPTAPNLSGEALAPAAWVALRADYRVQDARDEALRHLAGAGFAAGLLLEAVGQRIGRSDTFGPPDQAAVEWMQNALKDAAEVMLALQELRAPRWTAPQTPDVERALGLIAEKRAKAGGADEGPGSTAG